MQDNPPKTSSEARALVTSWTQALFICSSGRTDPIDPLSSLPCLIREMEAYAKELESRGL